MAQVQTLNVPCSVSSVEPASRPLLDLVSKFQNRLEADPDHFQRRLLPAALAPADAERSALEARRDHLDAALTPTPDNLLPTVSALLGAFPTYGISVESAKAHAKVICRALNDCPTWSVKEAAARFIKGEVHIQWNPEKAPTAPQIRAEAKWACLPYEAEHRRIADVLNATIVDSETTDAERQDALDAWAKLKTEIGASNVLSERTAEEITRERESMAKANERFRAREAAHRQSLAEQAEQQVAG